MAAIYAQGMSIRLLLFIFDIEWFCFGWIAFHFVILLLRGCVLSNTSCMLTYHFGQCMRGHVNYFVIECVLRFVLSLALLSGRKNSSESTDKVICTSSFTRPSDVRRASSSDSDRHRWELYVWDSIHTPTSKRIMLFGACYFSLFLVRAHTNSAVSMLTKHNSTKNCFYIIWTARCWETKMYGC